MHRDDPTDYDGATLELVLHTMGGAGPIYDRLIYATQCIGLDVYLSRKVGIRRKFEFKYIRHRSAKQVWHVL